MERPMNSGMRWTDAEEGQLIALYPFMNIYQLAEAHKRTIYAIERRLQKFKLNI